MHDRPLFEDNSYAGYDWTCHAATCLVADADDLDVTDPDDPWTVINRIQWPLDKLRVKTPPPTPRPDTQDAPF